MQKSKINKKNKLSKVDMDNTAAEFFDAMAEDMSSMSNMPIGIDSIMSDMLTAILDSSMGLSKLVIENRVRNADHMIDDDIYEIYKKSFRVMKETMDNLGE